MRRRSRAALRRVSVLVTAGMLAMPVMVTEAAAAPPTVPSVDFGAYYGNPSLSYAYGALSPQSRRLEISSATTELAATLPFTAGGYSIIKCFLTSAGGLTIAERQWSEDEGGIPAVLNVPIRAGSVAAGSATTYRLTCEEGEETYNRAVWTMVEDEGAVGVVVLNPDPTTLTRFEQSTWAPSPRYPRRTIAPGERVRVTSAVGTWSPRANRTVDVTVDQSPPDQIAVNQDGSIIGFTLPKSLPTQPSGLLNIRVSDVEPGSATAAEVVTSFVWNVQARIAAKSTTVTAVSLSTAVATSGQSVKASVLVKTATGATPLGRVTIFANGRAVKVGQLTAGSAGRVVLTLPRLTRGTYQVGALFSDSDVATGSLSGSKKLRVVF